jgi:hypothetical protein
VTKAVERYEKVRADWLLANEASWHLSDRRMANQLKRAAAKKDRAATGAAESSHHEGQIKPIASRFIAAGEDSKEKMLRAVFLALFILPTLVFWIGPALALSYGLYALDTERRLKQGRVPELKQWFLAAGATAAAGALFALIARFAALHLITVATVAYWPSITLDVHWSRVALIYFWAQAVLGLLLTAWQVRRHGWPGVVIKAGTKLPSVPTATAGEAAPTAPAVPTPDVEADEPVPGEAPHSAPSVPAVPAVPAVPTIPDPPSLVEFDEEPVFDDDFDFDEETAFVEEGETRKDENHV